MKIVCPTCQAKLKISDHQVPAAGVWAKCPKCHERFFIKPSAQIIFDLTAPFQRPAQAPGPLPRRDPMAQQIVERARVKRGLAVGPIRNAADEESSPVTVFPKAAVPPEVYKAIGLALLGFPILFIAIFFSSLPYSKPELSPGLQPAAIVAKINDVNNNQALIRQDLLNIRKDMVRRPRPFYGSGYSSSETRVFNYFVANMLPEEICSGIDYTEVTKLTSAYGFTVRGHCLGGNGQPLEMRVEWTLKKATIQFPYYQARSEFDLSPRSGQKN